MHMTAVCQDTGFVAGEQLGKISTTTSSGAAECEAWSPHDSGGRLGCTVHSTCVFPPMLLSWLRPAALGRLAGQDRDGGPLKKKPSAQAVLPLPRLAGHPTGQIIVVWLRTKVLDSDGPD